MKKNRKISNVFLNISSINGINIRSLMFLLFYLFFSLFINSEVIFLDKNTSVDSSTAGYSCLIKDSIYLLDHSKYCPEYDEWYHPMIYVESFGNIILLDLNRKEYLLSSVLSETKDSIRSKYIFQNDTVDIKYDMKNNRIELKDSGLIFSFINPNCEEAISENITKFNECILANNIDIIKNIISAWYVTNKSLPSASKMKELIECAEKNADFKIMNPYIEEDKELFLFGQEKPEFSEKNIGKLYIRTERDNSYDIYSFTQNEILDYFYSSKYKLRPEFFRAVRNNDYISVYDTDPIVVDIDSINWKTIVDKIDHVVFVSLSINKDGVVNHCEIIKKDANNELNIKIEEFCTTLKFSPAKMFDIPIPCLYTYTLAPSKNE